MTLLVLLVAACDASFENHPRVTPASESLWVLVALQINLDALRPALPRRVDALTREVVATCELLSTGTLDDDALRAARYRVDLIAVAWGLLQADLLASAGGVGGSAHAATLDGLAWIDGGFEMIHEDPLWPVKHPAEADRITLMAVSHRDNLRRSIPASALMRDGVNAAALTSGQIAAIRLVRAGAGLLARVGGSGPVLVTAGFAGGAGSVSILAGGRTLVLTAEEVLALAKAGVLSATALAVYMAASDLHHICTDKNHVSDKQGGPWTPRFQEYFEKAGMSLQDPENLVRVKAHQGPHPRAYHERIIEKIRDAVRERIPGTPEYREALKRALAELAEEIQTPGSRLNKLVTGAVVE